MQVQFRGAGRLWLAPAPARATTLQRRAAPDNRMQRRPALLRAFATATPEQPAADEVEHQTPSRILERLRADLPLLANTQHLLSPSIKFSFSAMDEAASVGKEAFVSRMKDLTAAVPVQLGVEFQVPYFFCSPLFNNLIFPICMSSVSSINLPSAE